MNIPADILEGCRKGKRKYQEQLYQVLTPRLFPVCMRYASSRSEAEDFMQDSWVRIFNKLDEFRSEGSFEGWARRITVTVCLEHLRRKNLLFDEGGLNRLQYIPDNDNSVLSMLSASELIQMIQTLPPGYRTVLNLFVLEEYSHEEIAIRLGISTGTSKSQLARAKQLLREKISKSNNGNKPQIHQQ